MLELREYQKEDVQFILNNNCCGVFSEMRTGKTPTIISALTKMNIERILVVCPASIVYQWNYETSRWSDFNTYIPASTAEMIPDDFKGIVIINYEKLRASKGTVLDSAVAWSPQCVVVDEAHRMKDRKTLTAQAIMKFKKVPRRIAVTGTPCTNKPWDVWTILNWLRPKEYSSYWNFVNEYFIQMPVYFGGRCAHQPIAFRPNKDRYLQAKISQFCIQRKRKDVMQWIDDTEPENVPLKPSDNEAHIISELEQWYEYKSIICKSTLDLSIRVRQICDDLHILLPSERRKSTKTEWLKQYINDYPNEKIIVFSNSKKYLTLLLEEVEGSRLICGDTSFAERAGITKDFQEDTLNILFIQTQAGKEGITLDNADTTIFMDLFPPSADYLQAKDRMIATTEERIKPKKLLRVYIENTLDEYCVQAVDRNIESTDVINNYAQQLKERKR